ncbi:MAG: hypothetical protein K8R54_16175 [Bacteroidales bacterium]|nr:hypothetical protein [Bacteroidales bacterium]
MKKYLIILILIISVSNLSAQYPAGAEFPNMPVSTGNKQNAVNLNTGAVSQTIPIWQASQDGLNIPVYLSYNSNGIKVSETGGAVGFGWSMTVGGSISVEQRGLYDLKNSGNPMEGSGFRQSGYLVEGNPQTFLEFLMNSAHLNLNEEYSDTEPDIFYYNFPGASGKFVFNNEGELVSLTDKSLIIECYPTEDGPLNDEISIINSYGIKYSFRCTGYSGYSDGDPSSPYFALYKAENLNTGNFIEINFSEEEKSYSKSLSTNRMFHYSCDEVSDHYEYTEDAVSYNTLYPVDSIVTNISKIEFNYKPNSYKIIDNITISLIQNNEYKVFKKISFNCSGDFLNKLTTVYNKNFNTNNTNVIWIKKDNDYSFEYRGGSGNGHDFWGYCNGKVNYLDTMSSFEPDVSKIRQLKKITYPMGNSIEYEFELNSFGAGLRVSKIIEQDELTVIINKGIPIPPIPPIPDSETFVTEYEYEGCKLSTPAILSNHFSFIVEAGDETTTGYFDASSSSYFSLGGSYVQYSKVIEYKGGKQEEPNNDKGKNGKIEYTFKNENSYEYNISEYPDIKDIFPDPGSTSHPEVYEKWDNDRYRRFEYNFPYDLWYDKSDINGLLEKTVVFDNQNNKLSETDNIYSIIESPVSVGLKLYDYYPATACYQYLYGADESFHYYGIAFYKILEFKTKLIRTENRVYKKDDENIFTENITTFDYAEDTYGNLIINSPVSKEITLSSGEKLKTDYSHPHNLEWQNNDVIDEMLNRNIKSQVLKTKIYKNDKLLSGANTEYRFKETGSGQIIVPDYSQIWEDGNYKTVSWFDKYNDKGQLLESHGIDGIKKAVLYGCNNTVPVASVINAEHQDIFYTSFEEDTGDNIITGDAKTGNNYYSGDFQFVFPDYSGVCIVSYWEKNAEVWSYMEEEVSASGYYNIDGNIDEVRVYPKNAYMSTAAYQPLIGKTSETDANGISVYYEYDCFGRLNLIRDNDKNIIKHTEYNNNENTIIPNNIQLSPTNLEFGLSGGDFTFEISAQGSWEVVDKPDWITLSQTTGVDNAEITGSCDEYDTIRNYIIIIQCGNETSELTINQVSYLTISPESLHFNNSTSETKTVYINASGFQWNLSFNSNLLSCTPASSGNNENITVSWEQLNPSYEDIRYTEVTATAINDSNDIVETISFTVSQAPADTPPPTVGISGYVYDLYGFPLQGVEMYVNDIEIGVTTNANGYYFIEAVGSEMEITPVKAGHTFDPLYRTYQGEELNYNQENQNYESDQSTVTIELTVDPVVFHFFQGGMIKKILEIECNVDYQLSSSDWITVGNTDDPIIKTVTCNPPDTEGREGYVRISIAGSSYTMDIPVFQDGTCTDDCYNGCTWNAYKCRCEEENGDPCQEN